MPDTITDRIVSTIRGEHGQEHCYADKLTVAGPACLADDADATDQQTAGNGERPDPLPMPQGVFFLFQPLTAFSALGEYGHKLTEGECDNCGKQIEAARVTVELSPDGIAILCQCPSCGTNHLLHVAKDTSSTTPDNAR